MGRGGLRDIAGQQPCSNLARPTFKRRSTDAGHSFAKLMAQAQQRSPSWNSATPGFGRGGGFRAGVLGGRPVHNASDLSAAPLPQITVPFRSAPGYNMPGGFQFDPSPQANLTQFPGATPSWAPDHSSAGPPAAPGGGEPIGAAAPPASDTGVAPASYGGAMRGLSPWFMPPPPLADAFMQNFQGDLVPELTPYVPPDPWTVFSSPYRGGGGRGHYAI
jgi:hypothetical protein